MGKNEYTGDFNNFINYKKYIINTVDCLNQPTNEKGIPINSYGTLLVEKDMHSIHQIFFPDSLDNVYIRRYNSTWTNWQQQESIVAKLFGQNSGYINYASGLIIQWGGSLLSQNPITITLPISFSNNNSAISVITSYSKDNLAYFYGSITENGSSIIVGANADNKAFKFITIGH